ncbi:MAG: hypothetical protein ACYC09_11075 [Bacteroidota bacterium]
MNKNKYLIIQIFMFVLLLPLSSCMHTMMMGSHDGPSDHQPMTMTKEVTNGDYTLTVSTPPLTVGKESIISLSLNPKISTPESIAVHYMISKKDTMGSIPNHDHNNKSMEMTGDFKTIHQNTILFKGSSSINYSPTASGNFNLMIELENKAATDSSFSVGLNFMVHDIEDHGMMGMGSMWDYPVIGVLAMSAMMITMWAIRGGL